MAIVALILGIYIIVIAIRGNQKEFADMVMDDFAGNNSFIPWIGALLFLWFIGLYEPMAPVSKALMILVLVVLFLKQGTGFFDQFTRQIGV